IFGDICDFDEIKTGVRREGTYSGINALITKPAISIGAWLLTLVLDMFGFDKEASVQMPLAIEGIMVSLTLIPAILGLLSLVPMYFYPVGGHDWTAQKKLLQQKHLDKERNLLHELDYKKEKTENESRK
nr:MFS transporter [Candidatus Sigynarchaeota archaeon]